MLSIKVRVMAKIRDHARSSQRLAGRALILGDAHHQARQGEAVALPGGVEGVVIDDEPVGLLVTSPLGSGARDWIGVGRWLADCCLAGWWLAEGKSIVAQQDQVASASVSTNASGSDQRLTADKDSSKLKSSGAHTSAVSSNRLTSGLPALAVCPRLGW